MLEATKKHRSDSRPRRSWFFYLSMGILLFGLWGAVMLRVDFWMGRSRELAYAELADVCKADLALRAAGLRQYARNRGQLPGNLADCGSSCIGLAGLLKTDALENANLGIELIDEQWAQIKSNSNASSPGGDRDIFGLPIIYKKGVEQVVEGAFLSSEGLPPALEAHFSSKDVAPKESPELFTLISIFLKDKTPKINRSRKIASGVTVVTLLGFLIIAIVTISKTILARKNPSTFLGKFLIAIFALVSIAGIMFGARTFVSSCYVPRRFRSSSFTKQERLDLLDKALRAGDVSPEVSRKAREYIDKLP